MNKETDQYDVQFIKEEDAPKDPTFEGACQISVIIDSDNPNAHEFNELREFGLKLQKEFSKWIIMKVMKHYNNLDRKRLKFKPDSPSVLPDKTKIFFKLEDTKFGMKFLVACDLDQAGNIVEFRVGEE